MVQRSLFLKTDGFFSIKSKKCLQSIKLQQNKPFGKEVSYKKKNDKKCYYPNRLNLHKHKN